jgi:ABC-2 type transport system permease protein
MKYWRTFLLAVQSEFTSRVNIVGWFLVGVFESLVLVLVWFAIMGDSQSLGGFTKGDFVVYYLFVTVGWYIVGGRYGWQVGNRIKSGGINTTLLKPYNVVLGKCVEEQAWKFLAFFLTLPVTIAFLFAFRESIQIALPLEEVLLLVVALIIGAVNFAFLEALVGITAFWVTDTWPVSRAIDILGSLFGGLLIPISLMPSILEQVSNFLPFRYTFYVPVSILLSKTEQPFVDVLLQIFFTFLLFMLYRFVWSLGIKKYEAIGA